MPFVIRKITETPYKKGAAADISVSSPGGTEAARTAGITSYG
jgi:hypothetical protein